VPPLQTREDAGKDREPGPLKPLTPEGHPPDNVKRCTFLTDQEVEETVCGIAIMIHQGVTQIQNLVTRPVQAALQLLAVAIEPVESTPPPAH